MKVALAPAGSRVPGMEIGVAKVGGFESHGMCCSEAELGISQDHGGIIDITDDVPLGTPVKEIWEMDDVVFEVDNKSLTNRPDLWGHYGIAREFATIAGRPLRTVPRKDTAIYSSLPEVDIDIRDVDHCYRYTGIQVENITVKQSPMNMRIRLFYCGSRAINLLADLVRGLCGVDQIPTALGDPLNLGIVSRRLKDL
jgi:phenylalanyl-tRNA synthetase beta chain